MPTYKVKDPETGKTISLKGDSPPTEAELEQIFAGVRGGADSAPASRGLGGLASDDVVPPPAPTGGPAEKAVSIAKRLGEATATSVVPTSIEQVRRLLNPRAGRAGVSRILQEEGQRVQEAQKAAGMDAATRLSESKVGQSFPRATAAAGATASTVNDILAEMGHTPAAMQENVGAEALSLAAKAFPAAARALTSAAARKAAPRTLSAVFGPTREAIEARIARGPEMRGAEAKGFEGVADDLAKATEKIGGVIKKADEEAYKTLSREGAAGLGVEQSYVSQAVEAAKASLVGDTGAALAPAQKKAFDLVSSVGREILAASPGRSGTDLLAGQGPVPSLSQRQVKDVIRQLDANINWDDPAATAANEALTNLRTSLDARLKDLNPSYASKVKRVEVLVRLQNGLRRRFNLSAQAGEPLAATDATSAALKSSDAATKGPTRKLLGKLKSLSKEDFADQAKLVKLADQFNRGTTQGSRRVAAGAILGTTVGALTGAPKLGAAAGATAGYVLDVEGGRMARALIDYFTKGGKVTPQMLSAAELNPTFQKALLGAIEASAAGQGSDIGNEE